jgi:hypothetical protein
LESLDNGGTDLLTLRTTLDAQAERSRHEYIALNKRIDYLENMIVPTPDVTGSVRTPTKLKRRGSHGDLGWNTERGNSGGWYALTV